MPQAQALTPLSGGFRGGPLPSPIGCARCQAAQIGSGLAGAKRGTCRSSVPPEGRGRGPNPSPHSPAPHPHPALPGAHPVRRGGGESGPARPAGGNARRNGRARHSEFSNLLFFSFSQCILKSVCMGGTSRLPDGFPHKGPPKKQDFPFKGKGGSSVHPSLGFKLSALTAEFTLTIPLHRYLSSSPRIER